MIDRIKNCRFNIVLCVLMIVDYIYTYLGIHYYSCISEGNPLMVWLFDLPFVQGFILRMIYVTIMFVLSIKIQEEYKHYNYYINFVLVINIFVIMVHFIWLIPQLL